MVLERNPGRHSRDDCMRSISNWAEEERYSYPNREKSNQSEVMFRKNQVTEISFLLCCCHLLG